MYSVFLAVENGLAGHWNLLLLLGIAIFTGQVGASVFQKLRVPQIIGYIIIGLVIGESGVKLISQSEVNVVEPFNYFALGIIGFIIGGELKIEIFRRYGRQFISILLAEGMAAFFLVAVAVSLLTYIFTGDLKLSVALGVVLGAISSATDPASTVQVLWEYKTRGALTTSAIAIVALDDALALSLYAVGTNFAGILTGHHGPAMLTAIGSASYEIGVSLFLGVLGGLVLKFICVRTHQRDIDLTFTIGSVLLVIGLSMLLRLDIILASMALGLTLANLEPRFSQRTFDAVKRFAPPIYVLFFVLVGARLKIESMSRLVWSLVAAYVICRSVGKISGSYLAALWSGAKETVRKYLGLCLFAQGGVAIGLGILASQKFESNVSSMVILIVASTTFIVQLIGPVFVKLGVKLAGEIGMNITEEELIERYSTGDMMDTKVPIITSGMSLREVVKLVSDTDGFYYPVVDNDKKLIGAVTLNGIRKTFATQELNDWLVALDIMEPIITKATPDMGLSEALEKTRRLDLEHLPVVTGGGDDTLVGVLDHRKVLRKISAEVLHRRKAADGGAMAAFSEGRC